MASVLIGTEYLPRQLNLWLTTAGVEANRLPLIEN